MILVSLIVPALMLCLVFLYLVLFRRNPKKDKR